METTLPGTPADDTFDRRLSWASVALVGVLVVVSTILHHWFPQVLHVPPPKGTDGLPVTITMELASIVMVSLCAAHCNRTYGRYATVLFLLGSFFFTGALENTMVLGGRFDLLPYPTFYYSRGGLTYFGDVPVSVCFGWFVFAYGSFFVMHTVFPGAGPRWSAALAGVFCMDLDLWYDPVMAHPVNAAWTWLSPPGSTTELFSIPLNNFPGWFGVICFFELLWVRSRDWNAAVGRLGATWRFALGVVFVWAVNLAMNLGVEAWIRRALPHVNYTFGAL
jgi:uncharacterized membrane protein